MQCEIKQINYKPEVRDDDGLIKKEAHFAVNLNIDLSPEMKTLLVETMLTGKSIFNIELTPIQPVLPGIEKSYKELGAEIVE